MLVSTDNGASYHTIGADRLAQKPIHVLYDGVRPAVGAQIQLYAHPAFMADSDAGALTCTINGGTWSVDETYNLVSTMNRIEADLSGLSVLAPLVSAPEPGKLTVTARPIRL